MPGGIVIPLDWQLFLAWNLLAGIALPGYDLPFHGPGRTSFRVRSVYGHGRRSAWTVITAEMEGGISSVPGSGRFAVDGAGAVRP